MSAPQTLLASLFDYTGLFPPAALSIDEGVRQYSSYRQGPHAELLGRLVVPLSQIETVTASHAHLPLAEQAGWSISVLTGMNLAADAAAITAHNQRHPGVPRIVAVEVKVSSPEEIPTLAALFPVSLPVWVEIPLKGDVRPYLQAIKTSGLHAKIRTGGMTAEEYPSPLDLVHFLMACHETGVTFKATTGLHHMLHGHYPVSSVEGSLTSPMVGFLNLFLAATYVHSGGGSHYALALLGDTDPRAFQATPDSLIWRGHVFPLQHLATARRAFCRSFGTNSFTDPIGELQRLHWL